ncbi:MAG: type II 3-dehydroquinate dehydratase [Desulfatibacillaceae bacterium]
MKKILVIHGPNLNMLGKREPEVYGSTTLAEIDARLVELGGTMDMSVETFQSNHEGEIVTRLQDAMGDVDGIIINPAAYTHTSVAIRDALLLHKVPVIECHISNVFKREAFRHKSVVSDIAAATMCGFGDQGYDLALRGLAAMLAG